MIDLLVLGSGIAGLTTALHAARAGSSVLVLTKGELAHSATRYAQGGVAAALAPPDSAGLHLADTLGAGAGLCDVDAVRLLVEEGPDRVRELAALGARFDRDGDALALALEGGHSLARVVHAGGDATGAEIERALVVATRDEVAEIREGWFALDLLVDGGRARGVIARRPDGGTEEVVARHTVLATGGAGQCFAVTTNPELSTGDGLGLALRAGVACADVEFVQFHPTALAVDAMPRPLMSEALRGEGACLRDAAGATFMAREHPLADLAPRDVVARAVHRRMRAQGTDHVWLDATGIAGFAARFPTIADACRAVGLDPARDLLPVAPAAHYLSGGVVTDLDGATNLPGLWACGEVACSGVHGANRLASNSLLDGLVFGSRVVDAIAAGRDGPSEHGALRGVPAFRATAEQGASRTAADDGSGAGHRDDADRPDAAMLRRDLQDLMSAECAVERDADGLRRAGAGLNRIATSARALLPGPAGDEVRNLATVARAIVAAATAREETRGAHARADHPRLDPALAGRFVLVGEDAPTFVGLPAGAEVPG